MKKHLILKRIKKTLRPIKKGDIVITTSPLSTYFIKQLIKFPITLKQQKTTKNKKAKIILEHTLDDECNWFLDQIINKKKPKLKNNKNEIKIFKYVEESEIKKLAKRLNIKFKPNKKNKQIEKIIEKFQKKYSQTKFSIGKTLELIQS